MWCMRRVPVGGEKEGMNRSEEDMCVGSYHLGFRRNSGPGRGVRCRYRRCGQVIVGRALRRRPAFRRRLEECWVIVH